ncbi:MAG: anti-sigma factor family protein [Ktedonobacterales bacterium]
MNELQPPPAYRNACLDRGLLVSLRDGELTPDETEQALAHLAACPDCSADARSLHTGSQELYDLLSLLGPASDELPDIATALAALQTRLSVEREHEPTRMAVTPSAGSTVRRIQARKPSQRKRWWIAAAAAAVLIALVFLPQASALANQFLGLFKAQTFQPVSVNLQTFRNGVGEDLQSFGEVNINADNLSSITHPTQAQIAQDLNFKLLLPGHLPPGVGPAVQFSLIDSANGTFTFDAAKARAYLAETGQGSVSIPPDLDGATFTITMAPGVIINYGKQCQAQSQNVNGSIPSFSIPGSFSSSSSAGPTPAPAAHSQNGTGPTPGTVQNGSGSTPGIVDLGCSGGTPFYIGEIPSPVIRATGKASLEDLRTFVLSLPKLSSSARVLLQDVNLTTGVVPLPIPPEIQAQQVTTHGAHGELMVDSSLSLGAVIWQTGGIVYMVAGATSDSAQLMDSVNSLH